MIFFWYVASIGIHNVRVIFKWLYTEHIDGFDKFYKSKEGSGIGYSTWLQMTLARALISLRSRSAAAISRSAAARSAASPAPSAMSNLRLLQQSAGLQMGAQGVANSNLFFEQVIATNNHQTESENSNCLTF